MLRWIQARPYRASLSSTLITAYRSPSAQSSDDFNEFLLLLEIMVDFVALRGRQSPFIHRMHSGMARSRTLLRIFL